MISSDRLSASPQTVTRALRSPRNDRTVMRSRFSSPDLTSVHARLDFSLLEPTVDDPEHAAAPCRDGRRPRAAPAATMKVPTAYIRN
jgi:hypothetical protein